MTPLIAYLVHSAESKHTSTTDAHVDFARNREPPSEQQQQQEQQRKKKK